MMALRTLAGLACGLLFGAGLAVSQMIDPAKVVGFLDFAGDWDPSLALVMAGALVVTVPAFALRRRRERPLLNDEFQIPGRRDIDGRLIAGAAVFGLGWGIAGFCPGPALAALTIGGWPVILFVLAMLAGMFLYRLLPSA